MPKLSHGGLVFSLAHGGLGAGAFVARTVALVGRVHATYGDDHQNPAFGLFAGIGVQLRVAELSKPGDYLFLECLVSKAGFEMSETGHVAGLALAPRVGVNLSALTVALSSTLFVDPPPGAYEQHDLTLVIGLHGGWPSE